MHKSLILLAVLALGFKSDVGQKFENDNIGFRSAQLEFPRVKVAFENKEVDVKTKLRLAGIQPRTLRPLCTRVQEGGKYRSLGEE